MNMEEKDNVKTEVPMKTRMLFSLGIITILVINLIALTGFQKVPTESMNPTIEPGTIVWTEKFSPIVAYNDKEYERGDIVSFCVDGKNIMQLGFCSGDTYVKRVVGLPGETVEFKNGDLYINGQLTELNVDTIVKDTLWVDAIQLEDDEYYVAGDNRGNSQDSRVFGAVKLKNIIGQTYTPFN